MNLNKVIIIGRIVREPVSKVLTSGTSVANLDIATSRFWKDKDTGDKREEAEFHKVVAFGRTAEIMGQYCTKGQLVAIEGRLRTRKWETKEKEKRQITEIIVEMLQLGPKPQAVKEEKIEDIPSIPLEPGETTGGSELNVITPGGEDGSSLEEYPAKETGPGTDEEIPF